MSYIKCPNCGKKQDETFRYCARCARSLHKVDNPDLDNSKKCLECGTVQNIEFKFCKNCGTLLFDKNSASGYMKTTNHNHINFCMNCGRKLTDEKFCPDCGKATGIQTCPECGEIIGNDDKFCMHCGCRFNSNL